MVLCVDAMFKYCGGIRAQHLYLPYPKTSKSAATAVVAAV